MSQGAEALESELVDDLAGLRERFVDEEFSTELYRALTNTVWRKAGSAPGHLSLSWGRAERLVNELRGRFGQAPLTLAQTGSEGEVSDLVAAELDRLGWRGQALNTDRHDPAHLAEEESPPPADHGERTAPVADSSEWERQAHEEAERNRLPTTPIRPDSGSS